MPLLPGTDAALVLRTDFSDDAAWERVCQACQKPSFYDGFVADLSFVSDPVFAGLTSDQAAVAPSAVERDFLFLVDELTISEPEMPVVAVDRDDEPGRWFRVVPGRMWAVQANLLVGNLFFSELAEEADPDGVFR